MALDIPEIWSDVDNLFRADIKRGLKEVVNEDVILQSLENILLTQFGERVMRPTFGSRLTSLLWENISKRSAIQLGNYIKDALSKWAPDFTLREISVIPEYTEEAGGVGGRYNVTLAGYIPILDRYVEFNRILTYTKGV